MPPIGGLPDWIVMTRRNLSTARAEVAGSSFSSGTMSSFPDLPETLTITFLLKKM
jgi:hypothetical protein